MQKLNWDDLRVFLAVARNGRFTEAGRMLGVDHTTVARRMRTLEDAMSGRLFERTTRGAELTEIGRNLLEHAERIESEVMNASSRISGMDDVLRGTVRLATPEAFGTWLVASYARKLHQRHPLLRLELVPEPGRVNLTNREADIAIMFNRPAGGPIVARHLVDYRLGLYASRDYLDRHGSIALGSLSDHPFASYIDERLDVPELRFLREVSEQASPVFRSTSIAAQHAAVAGGLGLGMLHAFAADTDPRLQRVLAEEVEVKRSYWIACHSDLVRFPRMRAVIDFLDGLVARHHKRF